MVTQGQISAIIIMDSLTGKMDSLTKVNNLTNGIILTNMVMLVDGVIEIPRMNTKNAFLGLLKKNTKGEFKVELNLVKDIIRHLTRRQTFYYPQILLLNFQNSLLP